MADSSYDSKKAKKLLRELGIMPYYRGYQITLLSLEQIAADEACLTALKKEIYLPVSEKICCNFATVEAEIRRTSERAWKNNPDLVSRIVLQELTHRPRVQQFLEALYSTCCTESNVSTSL